MDIKNKKVVWLLIAVLVIGISVSVLKTRHDTAYSNATKALNSR